jgi:hypothetical protein
MQWRFLSICFLVLGGGVSLLHYLKRAIDISEWAVVLSIAGFGFVLLMIQRLFDRNKLKDGKPNA